MGEKGVVRDADARRGSRPGRDPRRPRDACASRSSAAAMRSPAAGSTTRRTARRSRPSSGPFCRISAAPPAIVRSRGGHFMDKPDNVISLINLATVRELEERWRVAIDPLRFRANIYIDGPRALGGIRLGRAGHPDRRDPVCGGSQEWPLRRDERQSGDRPSRPRHPGLAARGLRSQEPRRLFDRPAERDDRRGQRAQPAAPRGRVERRRRRSPSWPRARSGASFAGAAISSSTRASAPPNRASRRARPLPRSRSNGAVRIAAARNRSFVPTPLPLSLLGIELEGLPAMRSANPPPAEWPISEKRTLGLLLRNSPIRSARSSSSWPR